MIRDLKGPINIIIKRHKSAFRGPKTRARIKMAAKITYLRMLRPLLSLSGRFQYGILSAFLRRVSRSIYNANGQSHPQKKRPITRVLTTIKTKTAVSLKAMEKMSPESIGFQGRGQISKITKIAIVATI